MKHRKEEKGKRISTPAREMAAGLDPTTRLHETSLVPMKLSAYTIETSPLVVFCLHHNAFYPRSVNPHRLILQEQDLAMPYSSAYVIKNLPIGRTMKLEIRHVICSQPRNNQRGTAPCLPAIESLTVVRRQNRLIYVVQMSRCAKDQASWLEGSPMELRSKHVSFDDTICPIFPVAATSILLL